MEDAKLSWIMKEIRYIKERNYWLVLTRTLLAGFNAPIDTLRN